MNGTAALDHESDTDNEALLRTLEEAKRDICAAIKDLERAHAKELSDIEELEKFKQRVCEKRSEFSNEIDNHSGTERGIDFTQFNIQALQPEHTSNLNAEITSEERAHVNFFTPLSAEAELEVDDALRGENRSEILATHENSNIQITRAVMQCLSPGSWLNDEVINLYMELLKEREMREPDCSLKCHFFNTFFYKKLYKDKYTYDYKAIQSWTTRKKLGYSLSDCNKILVPIHQDTAQHWCLAVISIRDKRLDYLDSLQGEDPSVLDVLARYIADEAKYKDNKVLDVSNWHRDFPRDIPMQENGFHQPWRSLEFHTGVTRSPAICLHASRRITWSTSEGKWSGKYVIYGLYKASEFLCSGHKGLIARLSREQHEKIAREWCTKRGIYDRPRLKK